jgi:hypothetical protein
MAARPGIIPLRPLRLGDVFDGAFRAIRYAPAVMFGLTALVAILTQVLTVVIDFFAPISLADTSSIFSGLADSDLAGAALDSDQFLSDLQNQLLATLIVSALGALAAIVLSGLLTFAVSRAVIGHKTSVAQAWAGIKSRIVPLLGLTLLTGLLMVAPIAVLVAIAVVLATVAEAAAWVFVLLAVLGSLVLMPWLYIRFLLAPAALVLEGQGVFKSLKRGWNLAAGCFWRLFGTMLLTLTLVGVATAIIALPLTAIGAVVSASWAPGLLLASALATVVTTTLATPFQAGVTALLYIDSRIRREALDVSLARAAAE